jgi:hypothetical protein
MVYHQERFTALTVVASVANSAMKNCRLMRHTAIAPQCMLKQTHCFKQATVHIMQRSTLQTSRAMNVKD